MVLGCYKFQTCIAYRRRLLKFVGSNLTPAEAFFWCSLLPVLSSLTATCEAILSVKEWNRKMKIKHRKRTVVIKNLRSVYISDQKTKSVYFKLRPLSPLSYNTAEYCLCIFLFLGSEGGPLHSAPPPYASACRLLKKSVRLFRADNKRTQLCLQIDLSEENRNHFTHRSHRGEHNKCMSRKKKIISLNVIKGFVCRSDIHPKHFAKLKPEPCPTPLTTLVRFTYKYQTKM